MSPTSPDNQSGFELPKPAINEALPPVPAPEAAAQLRAEEQSRQAELPGSSLPPIPVPPPATGQAPAVAPGAASPVPAGPTTTSSPAMADDVDLIEKEWVDKAKAIVDHTREDPHQQNKQLNEFKADYLKKRYGKEVRLTDE